MICLTGDVHHSGFCSTDLAYCKGSEIDAAERMASIAGQYGIQMTLFFTGQCGADAPKLIKRIASHEHIEVGGHNYYAFKPRIPFKLYFRIFGLKNGPRWFQNWEVGKTLRTLHEVSQARVESWRDHGFRHDRNTRVILREHGIRCFSDYVSPRAHSPVWNDGILDVPVNTLPDHEYVYHGSRQPGRFDETPLIAGKFGCGAMSADQWLESVQKDVVRIKEIGGVATILAHPACMEVIDGFVTFEKLCMFLRDHQTFKMKQLVSRFGGESDAEDFA